MTPVQISPLIYKKNEISRESKGGQPEERKCGVGGGVRGDRKSKISIGSV